MIINKLMKMFADSLT